MRVRVKSAPVRMILVAGLLFGCATPEPPPAEPAGKPGVSRHERVLGDGIRVEYQIDTRFSRIDPNSCYLFVTGAVLNEGSRRLQRHATLRFRFYARDTLLFQDIVRPRLDVAPGSRIQFDLIESQVFRGRCPRVDRVEIDLTPVFGG